MLWPEMQPTSAQTNFSRTIWESGNSVQAEVSAIILGSELPSALKPVKGHRPAKPTFRSNSLRFGNCHSC